MAVFFQFNNIHFKCFNKISTDVLCNLTSIISYEIGSLLETCKVQVAFAAVLWEIKGFMAKKCTWMHKILSHHLYDGQGKRQYDCEPNIKNQPCNLKQTWSNIS